MTTATTTRPREAAPQPAHPRPSIPPVAWVLSGAVLLAMVVLAVRLLVLGGSGSFFGDGDSYLFRATARDPFGTGAAFAAVGRTAEVPYRYGRIGLPLLAWVLVLGHRAWVGWSLIVVYVASIAAIPGIAAVLLDGYGAPPAAAAAVLVAPGLLLNYGNVFSDPLLVALLLLALVFDRRGRATAALVTIAIAILVKEVAALALVPWMIGALRRRDLRAIATTASALVPYAVWCVWLRWRVGAFPFLTHSESRQALALPGVGIHDALIERTPNVGVIVGAVVVTALFGFAAAWTARTTRVGQLAAVFAFLGICLGPIALTFLLECLRVLALAQILSVLCAVIAISARRQRRGPETSGHGLFVQKLDL